MNGNRPILDDPVYKYFRGRWKELPAEDSPSTDFREPENKIKYLNNKSVIELEELIMRQEKILMNKAFISKLSDKGKKIKEKYVELQNALKQAKENENNNKNQNLQDIESIEWGNNSTKEVPQKELRYTNEDGNDDDSSPLELLARHSVEYPSQSVPRYEEEDSAKLIQEELEKLELEDLKVSSKKELKEERNSDQNYFESRFLKLINKTQTQSAVKERFKPFRNAKTIEKGEGSKSVKTIPLEESLRLMAEANKKESFIRSCPESVSHEPISEEKEPEFGAASFHTYRDRNAPKHILDEYEEDINDFIYSTEIAKEDDELNSY